MKKKTVSAKKIKQAFAKIDKEMDAKFAKMTYSEKVEYQKLNMRSLGYTEREIDIYFMGFEGGRKYEHERIWVTILTTVKDWRLKGRLKAGINGLEL